MEFVESWVENGLDFIKIYSKSKNSYFVVAPQRGAIVILLNFNGNDILYLNKETLFDTFKNIRGGIPILFPVCGRVVDNKIVFKGNEYQMKNHGFARDLPWEVLGYIEEPEQNGICLRLVSNDQTKKFYPYEFELVINYRLSDDVFNVEFLLKNNDDEKLPFYAGFHPYFNCDKDEFTLKLDCDKCFDDVEKKFVNLEEFKEIDFSKPEVNLDFLDVSGNVVEFTISKDQRLQLKLDDNFKNIILWSLNQYDFVCVEPWMGEHEGYLSGKYIFLEPYDIFPATFEIALAKE